MRLPNHCIDQPVDLDDLLVYRTERDRFTLPIALVHAASDESVRHVLEADENSPDGRSQWVWVRLANGDLVLGVFPQGDTYFDCEEDAAYPDGGS